MNAFGEAHAETAGLRTFNVRDFGATGNGRDLDTAAIQAAIEAAARTGGTVLIPPGRFRTGMLTLRSHVVLHLAAGSVLLGSADLADYPDPPLRTDYAIYQLNKVLLYAQDCDHVGITGPGVLDGQGAAFAFQDDANNWLPRPMLVRFVRCRQVRLADFTLKNAAAWGCHLLQCEQVAIERVTIRNLANVNNDGFDIDSCRAVTISNCDIHAGDDAIALKTYHGQPCTDITVTNCLLSSRWAALRCGPESTGHIRNVVLSNCVIKDTFGSAIKLQAVGQGRLENVLVSNVVMDNVTGPISMRLGRWTEGLLPPVEGFDGTAGMLRHIRISNVHATVAENAHPELHNHPPDPFPGEMRSCINLSGIPGMMIEDIVLSNMTVIFPGGGTSAEAARRALPELEGHYPEYFMFGVYPAYGLYARHTRSLTLDNVTFQLAASDQRPAIVCDDVENLELRGWRAEGADEAESLVRLQDTQGAFIHGCRTVGPVATFLRVEGASADILLTGNDLRSATATWTAAANATDTAVIDGGNNASQ